MTTPYYFGFGSLVNDETLPQNARWLRANLHGWRRAWRHPIPGSHPWAAMDVLPDPNASIDGLLVVGGGEIDAYLVQRESGYASHALAQKQFQLEQALPAEAAPCLWTSKTPAPPDEKRYLMQSYVDVVMSGYLRHFGEPGLERFVESTDNWHLPVFDDRDDPQYPRAVSLSQQERAIIKEHQPAG